jgi:hypothetical protein
MRQHEPRKNETPEATKQRIEKNSSDTAKRGRVNTRRSTLSGLSRVQSLVNYAEKTSQLNANRVLIVEEERDDAGEKEAWRKIGIIVKRLSAAGMSSDDSGWEDNTRTVRKMPWRSPEISRLLITVDADANQQGLFGSARPGNPGKPRKHRLNAGNSRRNAVQGLPINFYNETWFASLRSRDRIELDPQDEFEIPSLSIIRST